MAVQKVSPWGFVGVGAMACLAFLYGASIVFWPWWVIGLLALVWVVLTARALQLFEPAPTACARIPLIGIGIYLLVLLIDVLT